MSKDKRSALNDEQMLFTMITALVKRSEGEIRITEKEMDAVTTSDMVLMYYDKASSEIILTLHLLQGPASDEVF